MSKQLYWPYLVSLMKDKLHVEDLASTTEFSMEDLLSITPKDIVEHLNLKAYGKRDPDRSKTDLTSVEHQH